MLENIIYERDYAEEKMKCIEKESALHTQIFDHAIESGFFKAYSDAMRALPKYIVPADKAAYEDLLPRLDKLASKWGGRIKGVVDYEKWESYIVLVQPFLEFTTEEEHNLLVDIATKTHIFNVTPTEDGKVRIYIMINYFAEIGDTENLIEETIRKDDKLVELLAQQLEKEKNYALENPEIAAFLENAGATIGMSAGALYDMIDEACLAHPDIINKLLYGEEKSDEDNK